MPSILHSAVLALSLGASVLSAQSASFQRYGSVHPSSASSLAVIGLPKLGSSFTVTGADFPGGCTFRMCNCTPCCACNSCSGAVLFVGVRQVNVPLPGGATLLASTELLLSGRSIVFPVPSSTTLKGVKFYMQRLDLSVQQSMGTVCGVVYAPSGIRGNSEGVVGTIGT